MTETRRTLSAFPGRPLSFDDLDQLEEHDRIETIVEDDTQLVPAGPTEPVTIRNCILITADSIYAAVYIDEEEEWQLLYSESRPGVDITEAYDVVREFRDDDMLFASAPLSPAEAIHTTQTVNKIEANQSEYAAGDAFDCPVCGETHIVKRQEEEEPVDDELLDIEFRYVKCPEARRGTLHVY